MPIVSTTAEKSKQFISYYNPKTWQEKGLRWTIGLFLVTYVIIVSVLWFYWSQEPDLFDVNAHAKVTAKEQKVTLVNGYTTTATLAHLVETLLDKPGGYISNDVSPPGVFMDNIPEWEFGVLVQIRDMSVTMRNDFSRSQSQSVEDKDLILAQPRFHYDSNSWILPSTEGQYRKGLKSLKRYMLRLANPKQRNAQFYSRADNLASYLESVSKRLGSLSQRLSASVGQERINTDLAGDSSAQQATQVPAKVSVKTPWMQIDNVFFEARGQAWALVHLLKAIETDFSSVLAKKNALISLRQIIRELNATQQTIWSPVILNGKGLGIVTNHSIIMSSYLSRANSQVLDLIKLLQQG
jgi:hypothetical protein